MTPLLSTQGAQGAGHSHIPARLEANGIRPPKGPADRTK